MPPLAFAVLLIFDITTVIMKGNRSALMIRTLERFPWALAHNARQGEQPSALAVIKPNGSAWTVDMEGGGPLAGPAAADVYVACSELYRLKRTADGTVITSVPELLLVMGRTRGGSGYDRVEQGCLELARVRITALKLWQSEDTFAICSVIVGERVYLQWSPSVLAMFAERPRYLDTNAYWALRSPMARRLYRYLDFRRWRGREALGDLRVGLNTLVEELPIHEDHPSAVLRTLKRATDELQKANVLTGAVVEGSRAAWRKKGDMYLRFEFPPIVRLKGERVIPIAVQSDQVADLVREMVDVLGDPRSVGFYKNVAQFCPTELVRSVLSECRQYVRGGELSPEIARKVFTSTIKSRAKSQGIVLAS